MVFSRFPQQYEPQRIIESEGFAIKIMTSN